jgi:Zn-finger nucleic acid-binding protein
MLKFKCPNCGVQLAAVSQMKHATQVVKRHCQRCGAVWQIKVTPMPVNRGGVVQIDTGEFVKLPAKRRVPRVPICGGGPEWNEVPK